MIAILEWKMAFRNLRRNKRRTLSTAIALVVAYVGISLIAGHVIQTEKNMQAMLIYLHHLGHVSVYKTGGIDNFEAHPDKYIVSAQEMKSVNEILKSLPDKIEMVSGSLTTPTLLSSGSRSVPVIITGVPLELDRFVKSHPMVKRWSPELLNEDQGKSAADESSLSETSAAISISYGVGELLGRSLSIQNMSVTDKEVVLATRNIDGDLNAVNATLSFKHSTGMPYLEDTSVVAPLALVQSLLQTEGADHIVIFLNEMSDIKPVVEFLQREFKSRGLDLEALSFRDDRIGIFYNGTMSFFAVIGGFFFFLILCASALIMVNSITMGVIERSKEMGTLRSLGYTPQRVRSLFVKEAFLLAFISVVAGVVLSQIGVLLVNSMGFTYVSTGRSNSTPLLLALEVWYHLMMGTLMALISVCCSYWIVTKRAKEKISILLLDSGDSQ